MWKMFIYCQMEDSIQICCGMGCPLTPALMKSMLHGVPLIMIQSLHRWKAALPWASREAVALRSSCMLVAAAPSLRFKPLEGSQQGGPTLNFQAKVWFVHFSTGHLVIFRSLVLRLSYMFLAGVGEYSGGLHESQDFYSALSLLSTSSDSHGTKHNPMVEPQPTHGTFPTHFIWVRNAKSLHYMDQVAPNGSVSYSKKIRMCNVHLLKWNQLHG